MWQRAFSRLIILAAALTALPAAHASTSCDRLTFVPIEPRGESEPARCDKASDKLGCQIAAGFSRFDKVSLAGGLTAHALQHAWPSAGDYESYVAGLEHSPAIRETNELRILARRIAHSSDACEPNYIYIGSSTVFGMGPAFVSSERFLLDGKVTTNVIMAEDAGAPFHIPLAMISKDKLIENSYYDLVIAHELAHGLMQDLYGVDDFAKLEKRVISRDGHMASATTDPTLALIEGFAEGFEAYLGEKTLDEAELRTPYLDKTMGSVFDRIDDFNAYGWKGYLFTIPGTIVRTARTMLNIDQFISEFLKAERQKPVRNNEYVLRGTFNNLSHHYGLPIATSELDADEVVGYAPENDDSVYSKEGVAAHFVYRVLHEGLAAELFETIHWGKPRDLWELASELPVELSDGQFARIADVYRTTFTAEGRKAVSARLKNLLDPDNRRATGFDAGRVERDYAARVAAIAVPTRLAPPSREFWVEFWNPSLLHSKLYGAMDRINLATASPGRAEAFLETLGLEKPRRQAVLRSLLDARARLIETRQASSLDRFTELWRDASKTYPPQLRVDTERAIAELRAMRGCFATSCLTHGLPRQ
ncbi:MAG: hypothetical protein HY075_10540 [Deltaproteobacteria bacterium]|nr:hypothetical protein [Deltaproteobacteria bacterium]